jgi:integrase
MRAWEGTRLKDTPENRDLVEAKAKIITAEIKAGTFDYLRHFPRGNRATTVGEYYRIWIERKKPPVVRAGLARDYREHFSRYILPKFESLAWNEVTGARLETFRSYLLSGDIDARRKPLSIKSCKNIINASFRACYRDARKDLPDELQGNNPFAGLDWPRTSPKDPDPFSEEERDKILDHFKRKIPHYYPFAVTQFLTGMRPSEALALRWTDIDLDQGRIYISKSRYVDVGATKTARSLRAIKLARPVAEELHRLFHQIVRRLDDNGQGHVFLNEEATPIEWHTWRGKVSGRESKTGEKTPHGVWYRALRGAGIRPRGPYHTRHTFISIALSNGANIKWLAEYCGTSVAMIEKHYGKYIRNDVDEQLQRVLGGQSARPVHDFADADEVVDRFEEIGGPTWIRTRDQPVMSRWL